MLQVFMKKSPPTKLITSGAILILFCLRHAYKERGGSPAIVGTDDADVITFLRMEVGAVHRSAVGFSHRIVVYFERVRLSVFAGYNEPAPVTIPAEHSSSLGGKTFTPPMHPFAALVTYSFVVA